MQLYQRDGTALTIPNIGTRCRQVDPFTSMSLYPRTELDVVDTRKEIAPVGILTPDHQAHRLVSTPQQITQADSGVHQASNQLHREQFS
jgi:hypothetical protein